MVELLKLSFANTCGSFLDIILISFNVELEVFERIHQNDESPSSNVNNFK